MRGRTTQVSIIDYTIAWWLLAALTRTIACESRHPHVVSPAAERAVRTVSTSLAHDPFHAWLTFEAGGIRNNFVIGLNEVRHAILAHSAYQISLLEQIGPPLCPL